MKKPPHSPSKSSKASVTKQGKKPISVKRQKILDTAMAQLKKTRAQMDPNLLGKIRSFIASNPKIMKGLGIDEVPAEESLKPMVMAVKPRPKAASPKKDSEPKAVKKQQKAVDSEGGLEKIDQAKNMEVMAKLMALKPSEVENIKAVLLKNKD